MKHLVRQQTKRHEKNNSVNECQWQIVDEGLSGLDECHSVGRMNNSLIPEHHQTQGVTNKAAEAWLLRQESKMKDITTKLPSQD